MTETWFSPRQIFDGQQIHVDWSLQTRQGTVVHMCPRQDVPNTASVQDMDGTISMGFIDLQVNGGGGVLFNADPSQTAIHQIVAAHRAFGTVGILPTVISDTPEILAQAVDAALAAKQAQGVLGLHIEGPHISLARRGTHDAEHLRPLDKTTLSHIRRLRDANVPVMITLAPEVVSPAEITALVDLGAIVSIGHSNATAEQTRAGLDAGATAGTHLFNAMSPIVNRAPGVVGALINSQAYCGLIVDGFHVAEEVLSLAIRARPTADRMFLVSDAMPTIGGPNDFDLYGRQVRLEGGRLINCEGSLAGAHLTQGEGLARLINTLHIPPAQALKMATTIPAELMGLTSLNTLIGRSVSDLICLDETYTFTGFLDDAA